VVERLGVRIAEHTPALDLRRDGETIVVRTGSGTVRARQVALATNAYQPLLRRLRLHVVPVYDHVLVTEPLAADQLRGIGWRNRQGVGDAGNQFHYYRLSAANVQVRRSTAWQRAHPRHTLRRARHRSPTAGRAAGYGLRLAVRTCKWPPPTPSIRCP
jgi:glycine/D-amino acid oxidase-like deaminating enzyme